MQIKSDFEVGQSPDKVWEFFNDIPAVASCLPGADISEKIDDDNYSGTVVIGMGPVKLNFAGKASVRQRDEANRRIVVDASGSERKGRGEAALLLNAAVVPSGAGSRVDIEQSLQLSGAAAQYGRGMVQDVTAILIDQFSTNMTAKLTALEQGIDYVPGDARPASGFSIALQALWMALRRVGRRFFLPYDSATE
ncbi:MAG: SRPBCC domain-containing protein [Acidimicrobiia bacterium]